MTESGRHELVSEYFRSTVEFWNDVYQQESLNGALYRARADKVLQLFDSLHLPTDARVLEIGCGAGRTAVAVAQRGYSIDAVDVVPEMLETARGLARVAGVADRLKTHTGNAGNLEFADRSFDAVLAIGVLEWSPCIATPLAEMARVLKTGGSLIVNVDNALALHCFVDPRLNPMIGGLKRLLRRRLEALGAWKAKARPGRCSPGRLDHALSQAGFDKVRGLSCSFGPFTFLGRRLLPDRTGVNLHSKLQQWADAGTTFIRSGGETYLTLAVRR